LSSNDQKDNYWFGPYDKDSVVFFVSWEDIDRFGDEHNLDAIDLSWNVRRGYWPSGKPFIIDTKKANISSQDVMDELVQDDSDSTTDSSDSGEELNLNEPEPSDYIIDDSGNSGVSVGSGDEGYLGDFEDEDAAIKYIVEHQEQTGIHSDVWKMSDHGNLVNISESIPPISSPKRAGMSTVQIDVNQALKMSNGWEVVSANDESCFTSNKWRMTARKGSADKVEGENRIIFTLSGGNFVEVEDTSKTAGIKTAIDTSDLDSKYIEKAIEAIENDDQIIHDVAADKGQIIGNVKHTDWFVEAVAASIYEQEQSTENYMRDKTAGGSSSPQTLYTVKCPKCDATVEITPGEKAISGKVTCKNGHSFEPTKYTPKSLRDKALPDFPKAKNSEDNRAEIEKVQDMEGVGQKK
jgi:hypothetical protein